MVNRINSSMGQYNGYLNSKVQYPLYQSKAVSFQGAPQPAAEDETKKKSSAVKKGIIGTIVGVVVAAAALYVGVKTGVLKKVDDPKTFTDKLKNLAFKGGDSIDKGVTALSTWTKSKLGKAKDGEMKPFPEKDSTGQTYFQFAPNEAPKTSPKGQINISDITLDEYEKICNRKVDFVY